MLIALLDSCPKGEEISPREHNYIVPLLGEVKVFIQQNFKGAGLVL
jgi:hypothetical protein